MSLFAEIEKTVERGFRRFAERLFGPGSSEDLVVVHRAILEEIGGKVQVLARGRRVFPFARILVTLIGDDQERRTMLEGAFAERLPADVSELLEGGGCEIPRGFSVEVRTAAAGDGAYEIEYFAEAARPAAAPPPEVGRLVVVKGKAGRAEYTLDRQRFNLGRMTEVTGPDHRVLHRNDVAFEDGADEVNATVSRRHAHIFLEEGEYRIADDGSEFGTTVFRDGRSIEVPAGDRRGERLRPGDEIYLGRACLRFER